MSTKYFGLFLIVGGIVGAFVSLLFNGVYMQCVAESIRISLFKAVSIPCVNGSLAITEDLFFGILISIAIILITFLVGRYLYKVGKSENISANLKMNKFVKIAVILFIASILIILLVSSFAGMGCGNKVCDLPGLTVLVFGVLPAMIMSGIAIILLIIHWLKNRGLK